MARKLLLLCGILSSVLYAAMNVFVAMRWPGYSSASQTVSELSAIRAPTRSLWVPFGYLYALLVMAFGCGVWASGRRNRRLRATGGLMVAYGALSLVWPFAPMHMRGAVFTATDSMHIALAMATVVLMFSAMGFGAAALGKRFRIYSFATIAVQFLFGALTGLDAPRIAANLPTPWAGVWERINIGAFLIWVAAVAVALLTRSSD